VDTRQIRYFLAVVEHGGFGRAAAALNVAQPTMSQSVKALERDLGTALFHRASHGVTLSAAGRAFLGPARLLMRDVAVAGEAVGGRPEHDSLEIVASAPLGAHPGAALAGGFLLAHPGVSVSLDRDTDEAVLARVRDGVSELGLVHLPAARLGLCEVELGAHDLVLAFPPPGASRPGRTPPPRPDHPASPRPDRAPPPRPDHGASPPPDHGASPRRDCTPPPPLDHAPSPEHAASPRHDHTPSPPPHHAAAPRHDTAPRPDDARRHDTAARQDDARRHDAALRPDHGASPRPDHGASLWHDQAAWARSGPAGAVHGSAPAGRAQPSRRTGAVRREEPPGSAEEEHGDGWPDGAVRLADLAGVDLLGVPRGSASRLLVESALRAAGVRTRVVVESGQRDLITDLVIAGVGAAFMPDVAAHEAAARGAVIRRVTPRLRLPYGLVHRPGELSGTARAFIDHALRQR
jgi:DNA-binding transcriptional LysR family regulator